MSEKELFGLSAQCPPHTPDVSSVWSIAVPEVDRLIPRLVDNGAVLSVAAKMTGMGSHIPKW